MSQRDSFRSTLSELSSNRMYIETDTSVLIIRDKLYDLVDNVTNIRQPDMV